MGVAEGGDDRRLPGGGRLDLAQGLDVDEATVGAVAAAEEGVDAVASVGLIGGDNVLGEGLDGLAVGEGARSTECLHRAGRPSVPV